MNKNEIIGVSRGNEFSPNHIDNDAAIFNRVAEELRQMGHRVETYTEAAFAENGIEARIVFHMARSSEALQRLEELERKGAMVTNSAFGIANCIRKPMTERLIAAGVPHPASLIVPTDAPFAGTAFPCWLKRADSHALVKEDVAFAANLEEAEAILADFRQRGIAEAVVNEHLQGDLVKFYGVAGSDFFYWFHPDPCSHSKFGLEKINGVAKGIPFDADALKACADKAAEVLGVAVYGGDAVVQDGSSVKIIDFNDWPSFARCREEAGKAIAAHIHRLATTHTTQ